MNKTKKIATAVVSLVLAATMCMSIAACSPSGGRQPKDLTQSQDLLEVSTDEDGNLSYSSSTSLNMNVGYNTSKNMQISYTENNLSGSVVLPDGKTYSSGALKPAWQALSDKLGVEFVDGYTNYSSSAQITDNNTQGVLANYQVITGSASEIVSAGTSDTDLFLDLSLYLDYMPNYKKFLQDNPIVYLSLTSDTDSGAMYYAPYFDGNDDIEKYELIKKNWVEAILDDATPSSGTITFAAQASGKASVVNNSSLYGIDGTSASCTSFMGTTGSWWVETTSSDGNSTVTITVDYDKALAAAKDESTALGSAYKAAAGSVYAGDSGNIVDIQNAAINAKNGDVTGAQLIEITKAYIDVAYLNANGSKYYSTRSDVFNGYDAAWDVDLLVALMRCCVTYGSTNYNTGTPDNLIYGVTGRQNNTQRMNDMVSLAGELYGVRGLTSRYEYSYIDSDGNLQDARADVDMYEALENMHNMAAEGLYNLSGNQGNGTNSYYTANGTEVLLGYDYVQTQTANGGYTAMGISSRATIEDDYDFEPIVTPVSKWNDGDTSTDKNKDGISYDYDSEGSKYMRFTESWRSVKDTGFCVPRNAVKNSETLAAVLAFIDYFYSNDGQILMSFGSQSTTNNATTATANYSGTSDNGWWYGTEVSGVDISSVATMTGGQYYIDDEYASQYFCYNNKLYTGTLYNGKQYPTMTNTNLAFYYGFEVNGYQLDTSKDGGKNFGTTGALSYTNYARYQIGAALPIGNKLQAFEVQCTADQGINGANIVATSLVNGTISHTSLSVGADNGKGYWYTIVPTTLPYSKTISDWISANITKTGGFEMSVFANDGNITTNFPCDIIAYGLGAQSNTLSYFSETQTMPDTAADCVALLERMFSLSTYETYQQNAWLDLSAYYDEYVSLLG